MNARHDPVIADLHRWQRRQEELDDRLEAREERIKERADELINELREWTTKRGFREWSEGMRLLAEEMARAELK